MNGDSPPVRVEDEELLLDALRERVGVTSAREGCGVGACGACTVLADGRASRQCLANAARYDSAELTTADGLPTDDVVVEAFVESKAMQCGYCIPGFVLMTKELLAENPDPSDEQIAAHLEGNICRCGTYPELIKAVRLAVEQEPGMRIETAWGTLAAIDEGTGPLVVLLHPLAQAGEFWRPLIDELSPRFRVLAPDARGHGQSTWDGSRSPSRTWPGTWHS